MTTILAVRRADARWTYLTALFGLALSLCGASARAATLNVPSQYPNIQAAVNAAFPHDTVLVANGTYSGTGNVDVDFGGLNITIMAASGGTTTINCAGTTTANHRGFIFQSGETSQSVLSGFVIENGYEGSSSSTGYGGGVYATGASPTIENCTFKNDTATNGGGVNLTNSGAFLMNCIFTTDLSVSGSGGGLYATGSPSLTDCTFTNNFAKTGTAGGAYVNGMATITGCNFTNNTGQNGIGGLYLSGSGDQVMNSTFMGNSSSGANDGGGIDIDTVQSATVDVTDCMFISNTSNQGGGVYASSSNYSVVDITNCTFENNTANFGGGIYNNYEAMNVFNCTFTQNTGSGGGAGFYSYGGNRGINITNCILYGDLSGGEIAASSYGPNISYSNVEGGYAGTENISADPLFVRNPNFSVTPPDEGDLHLTAASPCVMAGTATGAPTTDEDGDPRPTPPSIGAYEVETTQAPAPTITSFTPTSGPVGTVVTVTGTNFTGVTAVRFHNANATTFSANGAGTTLTVTIPTGAGTGTFTVTTPGGSVTSAGTFTVTTAPMPPTITSFAPTSGPVGTVVTVTGTHLNGVTAVRFHNANATVFSANAQGTQLTVTVPTGAGTGTFTVTTPGGSVKTTGTFTVTTATTPGVKSLAFNPGTVAPGGSSTGTVTLTSAAPAGGAAVTILEGPFTFTTVTIAAGQTTGTFTVTTVTSAPVGATSFMASYNGTSASATLTVANPPTVRTLTFSPSTIAPGGSSTATITLSAPALPGGASVLISQGAFAFETVTVPAGQTTATFPITAGASAPAGSYPFTATYNNTSASGTLTIN